MNQKKTVLFFVMLFLLTSCGNSRLKKSKNSKRSETIEQVSPDSAEMKNLELGVGYLRRGKKGDLDVALLKFKKAVAYNPKFALAHSMLANTYDKKGLFDDAERHYKLSIKHNNGSPDTINNYANFLCQREEYNKAIKLYEKVVANPKYKTPSSAYENAGVCSMKAGSSEQAEVFFRKAIEINDTQVNSLYYLMIINQKKDNYMKARAFLQRLEQLIKATPDMLAYGYKIEKGMKRQDLADKYLASLKSRFPSSDALKTIIE